MGSPAPNNNVVVTAQVCDALKAQLSIGIGSDGWMLNPTNKESITITITKITFIPKTDIERYLLNQN